MKTEYLNMLVKPEPKKKIIAKVEENNIKIEKKCINMTLFFKPE